MPTHRITLFLLAISTLSSVAEERLRVLIFSGQNNHNWQVTTPALRRILESSGRFRVDVTEKPGECDAGMFAKYDVILSNWNNFGGKGKDDWPGPMRQAFLDFVRSGKGHVVVHSGSSSFAEWEEYQKLVGATWGKGTGHGPVHTFDVKMSGLDHPITHGVKPFSTTDELWHKAATTPDKKVLATGFSAKDKSGSGDDEPIAMVTDFGKGRCFTLLLGHDVRAMESAGFQVLLQRGTEWAATARVTLPAELSINADPLIEQVKAYRFGDDRAPLVALEKHVGAIATDATKKAELAEKLAAILASDASVDAKQFVCRMLGEIGGEAQVPAIARLLNDEVLTVNARQALQRMGGEIAINALRTALEKAAGGAKVGIIDTLGVLRDEQCIPQLAQLARDKDPATAGAALEALGRIASPASLKALQESPSTEALKQRHAEALLRCAEASLALGDAQQTISIAKPLLDKSNPAPIRKAVFVLLARADSQFAREQILSTLRIDDRAMQIAAVDALRAIDDPPTLRAAAELLPNLPPATQLPLITLLSERKGASTTTPLLNSFATSDASVRLAVISAIGEMGDVTAIEELLLIIPATEEESKAIVRALTRLHGKGIDEAMIKSINGVTPMMQSRLITALVARECSSAVPVMIDLLATTKDADLRRAIAAGLTDLAGPDSLGSLIALLDRADPSAHDTIASAIGNIVHRTSQQDQLAQAIATATADKKSKLIAALAIAGGPQALSALRDQLKSPDPAAQTAALRALANWPDAAPLDDLAALATTTQDPRLRSLALRAVARLAPLATDRPADQIVKLIATSLSIAPVAEQKALLGALAKFPTPAALDAALAQLAAPDLADEAAIAVAAIIEQSPALKPDQVKQAIAAARAASKTPAVISRLDAVALRGEKLINLAIGATATSPTGLAADGQAGGPQAAIDSDPKTYWDEVDGEKLYVLRIKLKQPSTVMMLNLTGWAHHNYAPRDFQVVCDDKIIKEVKGATYTENRLTVALPSTPCTTLELRITGYYGKSPAIRELEILGKPAGQ